MKQFILPILIIGAASWAANSATADPSENEGSDGAVYTMDNSAVANQAWFFARGRNGELAPGVAYPTGGTGTGSGLGSQGAVLLSGDGRWLFVCNAGSDDVSVFAVTRRGLAFRKHRFSFCRRLAAKNDWSVRFEQEAEGGEPAE
jgi:hypothetical protein